jgi:hypothetical protein
MGAPLKNQYAAKGDAGASSVLIVRCHPRDKAGWVRSARRVKTDLSKWVNETLNRESGNYDSR